MRFYLSHALVSGHSWCAHGGMGSYALAATTFFIFPPSAPGGRMCGLSTIAGLFLRSGRFRLCFCFKLIWKGASGKRQGRRGRAPPGLSYGRLEMAKQPNTPPEKPRATGWSQGCRVGSIPPGLDDYRRYRAIKRISYHKTKNRSIARDNRRTRRRARKKNRPPQIDDVSLSFNWRFAPSWRGVVVWALRQRRLTARPWEGTSGSG